MQAPNPRLNYDFCVGGSNVSNQYFFVPVDKVYYAPTTSSGIGTFTSTTSYPENSIAQGPHDSCVINNGYIYCFGGWTNQGNPYATSAYYAPLISTGVGSWTSTTNVTFTPNWCGVNNDYVYCMAYYTGTTYYAQLSSQGIGAWTASSTYPNNILPKYCSFANGYVYCFAGTYTTNTIVQVNSSYYAPLSNSGVGLWSQTANFPMPNSMQPLSGCFTYNSMIYCFGYGSSPNTTSYAALSSSGIGAWHSSSQFPLWHAPQQCVADNGYAYCVFGQNADYYAQLTSSGVGAWIKTSDSYPASLGGPFCVEST